MSDRELLESKLRQQEDVLAQVSSRLEQAESELAATRRAAVALQKQLAERGQVVLAAEQAAVLHRAAAIRIQSWLSGGIDRDGQPGDDGLSVLVVPEDASGDALKLPGAIRIDLHDLSRPGGERSIADRQFSPDETARLWHRGLLGTGYLIELPWERTPTQTDLTLHVKLTAPDGREFHTTHAVKVRPPESDSAADLESSSVGRPNSLGHRDSRLAPIAKPVANESPSGEPSAAEPILQTSDRFTEETIPRLR